MASKSDLSAVLKDVLERGAQEMVAQKGDQLLNNAQSLATARVGRKSGVYHSSFRLVQDRYSARVVNDAPYAGVVESGSSPHPITPRRTRYLRIEPAIPSFADGSPITHLSHVNHPGTPARWVLRDALRETMRDQL